MLLFLLISLPTCLVCPAKTFELAGDLVMQKAELQVTVVLGVSGSKLHCQVEGGLFPTSSCQSTATAFKLFYSDMNSGKILYCS